MSYTYTLAKSTRKDKKYMVITPENKKVHFGSSEHEDYTMHKDDKRKQRYLVRHKKREDWTGDGMDKAGFWARWLLWNEDTIEESIKYLMDIYDIEIINTL